MAADWARCVRVVSLSLDELDKPGPFAGWTGEEVDWKVLTHDVACFIDSIFWCIILPYWSPVWNEFLADDTCMLTVL